MKKISCLIFALTLIVFKVLAQEKSEKPLSYEKGRNYISISYGLGAYTVLNKMYLSLLGNPQNSTKTSGVYSFKYERSISSKIGIGFTLNYLKDSEDLETTDTLNSSLIYINKSSIRTTYSILARINYHILQTKKFDIYTGIGIGYRQASIVYTYSFNNPDYLNTDSKYDKDALFFPVGFELVGGMRYSICSNLAIFSEIGISKAFIQIGLTGNF